MSLIDLSVILAGIGTFGLLLWTITVVPIQSKNKQLIQDIKRLEELIQSKDAQLNLAMEKISEKITIALKSCSEDLTRHIDDDKQKHHELFEQNRQLIAAVAKLEGALKR